MNNMFEGCSSLVTIPDISKWDTSKVFTINFIFRNCISLSYIPLISKWENFENIEKEEMKENTINSIYIKKKV